MINIMTVIERKVMTVPELACFRNNGPNDVIVGNADRFRKSMSVIYDHRSFFFSALRPGMLATIYYLVRITHIINNTLTLFFFLSQLSLFIF